MSVRGQREVRGHNELISLSLPLFHPLSQTLHIIKPYFWVVVDLNQPQVELLSWGNYITTIKEQTRADRSYSVGGFDYLLTWYKWKAQVPIGSFIRSEAKQTIRIELKTVKMLQYSYSPFIRRLWHHLSILPRHILKSAQRELPRIVTNSLSYLIELNWERVGKWASAQFFKRQFNYNYCEVKVVTF